MYKIVYRCDGTDIGPNSKLFVSRADALAYLIEMARTYQFSEKTFAIRKTEEVIVESPTSPPHYSKQTPEPIDVIEGWKLEFHLGNVIKYIARAGKKEGQTEVADLRKALRYLQRKINLLEGKAGWDA